MKITCDGFNSSNVERFEYDSSEQLLMVQYKSGTKRYVYKKVDRRAFDNLFHQAIDGGSVGGTMQFIKQHFDCEVEEEKAQ
jgi:hypothetical protein